MSNVPELSPRPPSEPRTQARFRREVKQYKPRPTAFLRLVTPADTDGFTRLVSAGEEVLQFKDAVGYSSGSRQALTGGPLLLAALDVFHGKLLSDDSSPACPKRINRKFLQQGKNEGIVTDRYSWKQEHVLGEGSFGKVYRAQRKNGKMQVFAIKQIKRCEVQDDSDVWFENSILASLDHPNVLRFLEAFEDQKHIYVVTELCLGGDLRAYLSRVVGNIDFAVGVARDVISALAYCHSKLVCHRDLKPDNILLVRDSIESSVRIADFGLAKRFSKGVMARRCEWSQAQARARPGLHSRPGQPWPTSQAPVVSPPRLPDNPQKLFRMSSFKGTPEFMAPEVIKILDDTVQGNEVGFYDTRCDIWSLGVVVHILLVGDLPYSLDFLSDYVSEGIRPPELDVMSCDHEVVSSPCRDFLRQCLSLDFTARPSADELLRHTWLSMGTNRLILGEDEAVNVAERFVEFSRLTPLKRTALLLAARHLGSYELEELRALFSKLDTRSTGQLTTDDLRRAINQVPTFLMPPSIRAADDVLGKAKHPLSPKSTWVAHQMTELECAQSGTIEYSQFLAIATTHDIEARPDLAWAAFRSFDAGNKGFVSRTDIEHVVDSLSEAQVKEIACLPRGDEVDFDKFLKLLALN